MAISIFNLPFGRCCETSPEQYVRILTNLHWVPIEQSNQMHWVLFMETPTISSAIIYPKIRTLQCHGSYRTKTFLMALLEDAGPATCLSLLLPQPCWSRYDSSYPFLCIREWNCSRTLFDLRVDHQVRVPIRSCNYWLRFSRHHRN